MLDRSLAYHSAPSPPPARKRKERFPFVFDRASVGRFCAERRRYLPMAINAASAELRWNQQTVLSMLRAGEIRALPGKGKFRATSVSRAEIVRAKLDYVTTAQIGARLPANPSLAFLRMLARELRRLGLVPVVGGGGAVARNGQLIWRSGDLTDADWRALSGWARRSRRE